MTGLVAVVGLILTVLGATSAAALVTASRNSLAGAVSRRLRGASESLGWLERVDRDLAAASVTTSLGIIVVGAAFPAAFAGITLLRLAGILLVVAIPVVVLSGYVLPRWLTHTRAERIAEMVRPVLRPWGAALSAVLPIRKPARPAEVRALMREASAAGFAPDQELLMVGGVMSFAQRLVRDVMTPRTDLVAVPEDATFENIVRTFTESGYSRIPVYRDTLDEIIGMLHAFDLFRLAPGDPLPVRPVALAPASRTCGDLLVDMQRERRHLAVVLDEFGGTLGIATLEDLLEEMVGEIYDEFDPEVAAAPAPPPGILETDGSALVTDVEERFGVRLPAGHAGTIGGRLVELAGRIPQGGERLVVHGLEFDVVRASQTRVDRLVIRPEAPPPISLSGAPA